MSVNVSAPPQQGTPPPPRSRRRRAANPARPVRPEGCAVLLHLPVLHPLRHLRCLPHHLHRLRLAARLATARWQPRVRRAGTLPATARRRPVLERAGQHARHVRPRHHAAAAVGVDHRQAAQPDAAGPDRVPDGRSWPRTSPRWSRSAWSSASSSPSATASPDYVAGPRRGRRVTWRNAKLPAWAAVSTMVDWRWTGYNALIYLAAMQAIPKQLYESAAIDGASRWRQFWKITVPLIRPTILFTVIMSTIGGMQLFTEPLLFNYGRIQGGSLREFQTVAMYIYERTFTGNFGRLRRRDLVGVVPHHHRHRAAQLPGSASGRSGDDIERHTHPPAGRPVDHQRAARPAPAPRRRDPAVGGEPADLPGTGHAIVLSIFPIGGRSSWPPGRTTRSTGCRRPSARW